MFCRNCVAALAISLGLTTAALAADKKDDATPCASVASIGVAHMTDDGVITLRIRSLPPGPIAEGELRYAPSDPKYDEIKQHLGGIAPGESKTVPPWC